MAAVDDLMVSDGASIYYDDSFRNVLEDHMTYLRTLGSTTAQDIAPIDAYRFEFDLTGLLNKYQIPPQLHWIVMRMNNIESPMKVPTDITALLVPDAGEITRLQQSVTATNRIK